MLFERANDNTTCVFEKLGTLMQSGSIGDFSLSPDHTLVLLFCSLMMDKRHAWKTEEEAYDYSNKLMLASNAPFYGFTHTAGFPCLSLL